jgi:hypothetical protein
MTEITRKRNLNPVRHRTCPRAVKRWRNSRYEIRKPADRTIRHNGPPTIKLANPVSLQLTALADTS